MLRYFPFEHDEYDMPMNARAGIGPLIEVEEGEYTKELTLKDAILASDYRYYFQCPPEAEPLARCIGAEATLLAVDSGDDPFDEACSQTWWRLRERFAKPGTSGFPIPLACLSATVELRGMADVSHTLADADAAALVAYLQHSGVVCGAAAAMPPLRARATALEAVDVLVAPVTGIVVFRRALGERIAAGDHVLDVVDPITGQAHAVHAKSAGLLFAREAQRYATAGWSLCKIAGEVPVRRGKLTSA